MYYVYGLVDPTNNMVSYVGITSNTPHQRFVQHLRQTERDTFSPKGQWLNGLLDNGYFPVVVSLQMVETEQQAQIAERWWIAHGQMIGWPLRNTMHFVKPIVIQDTEPCPVPDSEMTDFGGAAFPIGERALTTDEADRVRRMHANGASKNKILDVVYGGKTPKRFAWVSEALNEGGAA